MSLSIASPIQDLVKTGIYGNVSKGKQPNFTLLHQKDTSIVKITLYASDHISAVSVILKSVLGLMVPNINQVYVSGMRQLLRLDDRTLLITTQGEARGVLFERLNYQ